MNASDSQEIRELFNECLQMYATALGRDDMSLFSEQDAGCVTEVDPTILATAETVSVEHFLTNAVGEKIVVQSTKGPLHGQEGEIVGVFGIFRDVTDQRRAGDKLRTLNEELDVRVRKRTEQLETAIREQESFSYSVSHDLRAPLRHINGYCTILEEDCGDSLTTEAWNYLEKIRVSSRKMGQLIDELLELSRLGRSELKNNAINLGDLAGKISIKLQELAPERKAEFLLAPNLTVNGDRVLLALVLENLLGNAW